MHVEVIGAAFAEALRRQSQAGPHCASIMKIIELRPSAVFGPTSGAGSGSP